MKYWSGSSCQLTSASKWFIFFFSSRRRHTRCSRDWSSDVCSSDLVQRGAVDLSVSPRRRNSESTSRYHSTPPLDGLLGQRVSPGPGGPDPRARPSAHGRIPHREDQVLLDLRSEEHTSELQSRLHLVCRL